MFRVGSAETGKAYRLAIAGLLMLSVAALGVTIWVMNDLLREQVVVAELIHYLPPEGAAVVEKLAGELRWQFRMSILVVLNLIVTGLTVLLLWRAYRSSQESLREFKAFAGDILGSMDQAVITCDVDGFVTSINRRGVELLAVKGDPVGKPIGDLSRQLPLGNFRERSRDPESPSQAQDFQFTSNGTNKTLRAFCQPLNDHDNTDIGDVVELLDATERVLMDDRMRRMERYMGLGSLAVGLHHEIKNPLAALSLHVQLIEEDLIDADASPAVLEMMGVVKKEMTRVGRVLESFRDFASMDQLNLSEVDLAELIDRPVNLIRPQAQSHNIEVYIELPTEKLPTVSVDRVRMEQVLLNLLINAMEAMPDGGKIRLVVSLLDERTRDLVRIEVIDNGRGIPENLRNRILEPYFTTKSKGTGMGLALCDKIIRQHQGTLDFGSTEHGSVFHITLPVDGQVTPTAS